MKALRWHGPGDVRLDDVDLPGPPGPTEVRLEVEACGICGTDVEEWREGPLLIPVDAPHPLTGGRAPLTLGHEVAGVVTAAGRDAGLEPGQRVAVDGLVTCGACRECRRGRPNLCARQGQVGLMADGGLQPVVNVPAEACVTVPEHLDPVAVALAEPLSVAVRALRQARLAPGDRVAVMGGGAVGLLAVQVAVASGAGYVTLVEPHDVRRRLGLALGAAQATVPEELEGAGTDDTGYDVVVECSGAQAAAVAAVHAARRCGRVALVGLTRGRPELDLWDVVSKEKELIGSFSHVCAEDFAGAVALLASGAVTVEGMVRTVSLSASLDDGLLALAERPEDQLKLVVVPDERLADGDQTGGAPTP